MGSGKRLKTSLSPCPTPGLPARWRTLAKRSFTAMNNIADAVVAIDGAVTRASESLNTLQQKLASFGSSNFFKNLNEVLGLTNKTPEELAAYGITPTKKLESTSPDAQDRQRFRRDRWHRRLQRPAKQAA